MNNVKWGIVLAVGSYVGCSGKLNVDSDSSRGGSGGAGVGAASGSAGGGAMAGGAAQGNAGQGGTAAGGFAGTMFHTGGAGAGTAGGAGAGTAGIGGLETGGNGGFGAVAGIGEAGAAGAGNDGELGQLCVASTTTLEAQGTPAETNIVTLEHCNDGLSCDAGTCVASPKCPATIGGRCTVQDGSAPATRQLLSPITLDATRAYWTRYGTRDALGNHQHDGSVQAYDLTTGVITTIATGFDGPIAVSVTTTHAYVTVDGAPLAGVSNHYALLRVPLAGGASELVSDGLRLCEACFASVGDRAFLDGETSIDTISAAAPLGGFYSGTYYGGLNVSDDGQTLFANTGSPYGGYGDIDEIKVSDGSLVRVVSGSPVSVSVPHGDSFFGLEQSSGDRPTLMLDSVPIAGGSWQRLRGLGSGGFNSSYRSLKIVGDHYFIGEAIGFEYYQQAPALLAVSISSPSAPPVRVLRELANAPLVWTVAPQAILWTDYYSIYSQSITSLP